MNSIDPIELERVQWALDRLAPRHAQVFAAVRHEGLAYAEIGQRTGLTPRQVERIFADALYWIDLDVWEQEQGIALGPLMRFLRTRALDFRLRLRLWLDRS